MSELQHKSLNATLVGVDKGVCTQYRGIQYGEVAERFADPKILDNFRGEKVDCTEWGPRCPQNKYDLGHLIRAPEGDIFEDETEDEFKCLNLDVTVPSKLPSSGNTKGLPVMVWVHGGSQIVSYGTGSSKIGDPLKLAKDSVELSLPMIIVSLQYRLNMFHYGDGKATKNLGLKDQQIALKWVQKHIAGFGGDPDDITVIGESAGAVFAHALLVTCPNIRRGILMSGSLYLSPPQPAARGQAAFVDPMLKKLQAKGYDSLKDAPVEALLEAQAEVPIPSVFMQEDSDLEGWSQKTGDVEALLIGDCEYESILWRNGVETMTAEQIVECFDKAGASASELKKLYHINPARSTQSKHGVLDFLNDMRFAAPVPLIADLFRKQGKKVYTYLFDQPNPWQPSSRAHHAVDLLYLFEGFDISHSKSAAALGQEMRKRFITFITGQAPWSEDKAFAFGPLGKFGEISEEEIGDRRRIRQIEALKTLPQTEVNAAFGSLAAGRISLHN